MKDFKGRVAVVTGAASGIGRGLAARFAAEGMRVVLADVEPEPLAAAERELASGGAEVLAVRTDVSDERQVEALALKTFERFGAAHVVCNNAGVGSGGNSWEVTLEDWRWVLGVNLWGVIHGVRAFVPRMLAAGDEGHIVNTASMAGLFAGPFMAPYNVSKFGVVALTETLNHELTIAGSKIRASVLCPGFVNTNIDQSDRNRPGGPRERPTDEVSVAISGRMRAMLDAGLPPATVAGIVVDAIREQHLYVLTHREYDDGLRDRAERIIKGDAPPLPGFV